MSQQKVKLQYRSVALLTGLVCMLTAVPSWADNEVKTVTYFPTPYMKYNNIYIGKKLDIGVAQAFRADLGNADCNTQNSLKSTGELPSLWLPSTSGTQTPLFLRSSLPNGNAATGVLNLSGLNTPLYVKEAETGKRSTTGSGANLVLSNSQTDMDSVSITVSNLVLGIEGGASSAFKELSVTGQNSLSVKLNNKENPFPKCTAEDGSASSARWKKLRFNNQEYTVLACGEQKEPFESSYTCDPSGKLHIRCELNNNQFYCDSSVCTTTYYSWKLDGTQTKSLPKAGHQAYCNWFKENPSATINQKIGWIMNYLMSSTVGSDWMENQCLNGAPDTSTWKTTAPSPDPCYHISSVSDPTTIPCSDNSNENYTDVPSMTLTYSAYTSKIYFDAQMQQDCTAQCTSFN